jgi:CheY-like chemotaxis protein
MIVDDDRITVGLLQTLLQLDGFDVVMAADSHTAFAKAEAASPDAFLVDYHLADVEGTEFVKQLRASEQFSETPVIMTSGLNRKEEAMTVGANVFLIKPFDPGDLVEILQQLLAAP